LIFLLSSQWAVENGLRLPIKESFNGVGFVAYGSPSLCSANRFFGGSTRLIGGNGLAVRNVGATSVVDVLNVGHRNYLVSFFVRLL
jgi:hypothetical protein